MIYIERNIRIKNNEAVIEQPIVLYKGDMNIELQFTIENNPFKYKAGTAVTYGQLVIRRPEAAPIFSEPVKMSSSKVLFTVSGDMIDELEELGEYDFQIQLLNNDQTSRGSLPPVYGGIIIRDPLCEGAATNRAAVNSRSTFVMRATNNNEGEAFDDKGNYNATTWKSGDIITDARLNKVEDALYQINDSVISDVASRNFVTDMIDANNSYLDDKYLKEEDMSAYATKENVAELIEGINLDSYADKEFVNDIIASNNDELDDKYAYKTELDAYVTEANFENQVLEATRDVYLNEDNLNGYATEEYVGGALEPYATKEFVTDMVGNIEGGGNVDLTGYATEQYVQDAIDNIEMLPIRVIGNGADADEYIFTGNEFTTEEYENGIGLSVLLDNVNIAGINFTNELGYSWLWTDGDNRVISFDSAGWYYEFAIAPDGTISTQQEHSYVYDAQLENYATKEELQTALGDIESLLGGI